MALFNRSNGTGGWSEEALFDVRGPCPRSLRRPALSRKQDHSTAPDRCTKRNQARFRRRNRGRKHCRLKACCPRELGNERIAPQASYLSRGEFRSLYVPIVARYHYLGAEPRSLLQSGDLVLLDPRLPFSARFSSGSRFLIAMVPRKELEARVGNTREMVSRTLSSSQGGKRAYFIVPRDASLAGRSPRSGRGTPHQNSVLGTRRTLLIARRRG